MTIFGTSKAGLLGREVMYLPGRKTEGPLCENISEGTVEKGQPERLTLCGPVANLLAFGFLNVRTGSQLFGF
jgi:hypothetical protein